MKSDITDLIERLPAFEERTGVRLDGLFGELQTEDGEYRIEVRGELHAAHGNELAASIDLVLTAYDDKGRVIATTTSWFNNDSFFGFEAFELSCYDIPAKAAKLRLYPKLS